MKFVTYQQIDALLDIHARAPGEGGAWCGGHPDPAAGWTEGEMPPMPAEALLMGDFNFEWSAPEYDRVVGPLTEQFGRLNRLTGFVDAWVAAAIAKIPAQPLAPARELISASCRLRSRGESDPVASMMTPSGPTISRSGSKPISKGAPRLHLACIAIDIVTARARTLPHSYHVGRDHALTRGSFARILVSSADLKPMLCDATSQLAGA